MGDTPTKRKATQAHMKATAKWEAANYDKVLIRFPRGTKDRITATGATVNGFTVSAVIDRLDGKAQPDTPPATVTAPDIPPDIPPDMECISALSPVDQRISARIDGAVKYGYGVSRDRYIIDAILSQLRLDEATERRKRAQAKQARLDAYYANMPDNWDDPEPDY